MFKQKPINIMYYYLFFLVSHKYNYIIYGNAIQKKKETHTHT